MAATLIAGMLAGYALTGLLFASAFVAAGVQKIDQLAASAGIGFRLTILPGAAALWPLLLIRWIRAARRPE
jgi:hypothetical protein